MRKENFSATDKARLLSQVYAFLLGQSRRGKLLTQQAQNEATLGAASASPPLIKTSQQQTSMEEPEL